MPNLYRNESSDAKRNAQRNLSGRTHYVDDDTLRFHYGRVLSSRPVAGGLLFAIVESVGLDMHNRTRGCRYVVFDIFGNVISRVDLEQSWKRSEQAAKAMWAYLDTIDAKQITLDAIKARESYFAHEMEWLRADVEKAAAKVAA